MFIVLEEDEYGNEKIIISENVIDNSDEVTDILGIDRHIPRDENDIVIKIEKGKE